MNGEILMNNCIVMYDGLDMACCGTPFEIGQKIKWYVCDASDVKIPIKTEKINYRYDVHGQYSKDLFVLKGEITKIKVIDNRYKGLKNILKRFFIKDKIIFDIKNSDEIKAEEKGDIGYTYLVYIENYNIIPLK